MGDICKILIQNGCRFITHSPTISSYAQLSKLATQSEVRNAQPSTSLYHYSGQKPKNIFFHILVQTKTSLRPFPILPTFREYKFAMGTIFLHKHKCIQITAWVVKKIKKKKQTVSAKKCLFSRIQRIIHNLDFEVKVEDSFEWICTTVS